MNNPTQVPSKEKLPDWLRRWYALKGELRFREAADEIERLQRDLYEAEKLIAVQQERITHEPPAELWGDGTREMLIQLRDWLKSKMPCPAGNCCDELRAWIEKVDQRIHHHAPAASSQPPAPDEDVIRSRAFWSDGRRDLITAYVSNKDITLMNDNGHVYEPAGEEMRHGPSPTKEARPFTPMDREQLREKIAAGPDPEPEIGAGTLSIDWNEVGPVDAKECSGSGEEESR